MIVQYKYFIGILKIVTYDNSIKRYLLKFHVLKNYLNKICTNFVPQHLSINI